MITQLTRREVNQLRYYGSFVLFHLNYLEIYFLEFASLFLFWVRLGHERDLCKFGKVLVMKQPYFYVPWVGAELQGLAIHNVADDLIVQLIIDS